MTHFAFLGTSGAIPSPSRDTTSLVFVASEGAVLVDCGGSPVQKLRRAGVDPLALAYTIVTHLHPDHAYGLPALVQSLILLERETPLVVLCRPEHVEPLESLLKLFGVWARPGMFPLWVRATGPGQGAHAFDLGPLAVRTSPVEHGSMPNFAVRVDVETRGVVYSSDTKPCDAVVALARSAWCTTRNTIKAATNSATVSDMRVAEPSTAVNRNRVKALAANLMSQNSSRARSQKLFWSRRC